MTRTERIQKIMDKYEISAKIGFGQNFLMDDKAIEKMEEANLQDTETYKTAQVNLRFLEQ